MNALANSEFLFIVGLPGSGKTFYTKKLAKQLNCPFLDDPKDLKSIIYFANRNPSGILCSPNFCLSHYRNKIKKKLKSMHIKSRWIYYANSPDQCFANDLKRKGAAGMDIYYFSSLYRVPSRSIAIPVYKKTIVSS